MVGKACHRGGSRGRACTYCSAGAETDTRASGGSDGGVRHRRDRALRGAIMNGLGAIDNCVFVQFRRSAAHQHDVHADRPVNPEHERQFDVGGAGGARHERHLPRQVAPLPAQEIPSILHAAHQP